MIKRRKTYQNLNAKNAFNEAKANLADAFAPRAYAYA